MKNKKKIKLPLILIILILVVSVGYALLTSEGSIQGWSMLADSKWDIHFTNLVVNEGSTDLSEEDSAAIITEDNTQVTYRVTLNKPGDFYEFTVDVKNFGTIDGMVNLLTSTMSIDGEDSVEIADDKSNLPEYLDYSITYNDGTKIDKNHELKAGEYETYKVRVEFKKDITADQLPTEVKTIVFNITPEFVQANEQAIEKPSPFITRVSAEGLGITSYEIDYDKCIEHFSDMDNVESYCKGEDINDNGYTYNIKQDIVYDYSYYEERGIIKNIKYGKVESYEINHDGCVNYLKNNGEEDEEQIELVCTGNTATIFGQEINLNDILETQPEYIGEYVAIGVVNATYTEAKPYKIITGYEGNVPKNLVIPKTINGSTVIGIEEEVFKDKGIESVTIPNTIEFIGRKAFDGNNLKSVKLEENTLEVNYCSFGKKESITTNNLPENYYCEQIYWALQDNDSDDKNETLVISESEVIGNEYGRLDGDIMLSSASYVPWVATRDVSTNNKSYNVSRVIIDGSPKPQSTAFWFYGVGYNATTFTIDLAKLDTSKVTDMSSMFAYMGYKATSFNVDLSNIDTSNVTIMHRMFYYAGYKATTFNLNLSQWDTSKVTNMGYMFYYAGFNTTTFNLNLSEWDTSKVKYMGSMFYFTGRYSTSWSIGDISNWDTSQVIYMNSMFSNAGANATTWNIGDLSNWDTSQVTDMGSMFGAAGYNATTWNVGNLNEWDVSKVTNMRGMFSSTGGKDTTFDISYIENWNTSKVTDMEDMFSGAGRNATTWNVGDISNWDTSNVTSMHQMFWGAGRNATTFNLDLSNWDTSKVTEINLMFQYAGQNATTLNLNLNNWDTSNVTSMQQVFYETGKNATTLNLNLSNWNTSKVTNMSYMFSNTGQNATTFSLTIPQTNGNGISNNTTHMYGSSTSTYAEPPNNRRFTIASN